MLLDVRLDSGFDIDGWPEHQQNAKDQRNDYDEHAQSAHWEAHYLGQKLLGKAVRLLRIAKAPMRQELIVLVRP